jgi:hypothetical protein
VQIIRWWNFCDSLDVEGVHCDAMLGDYEPQEVFNGNAKYTLEGVEADIVLATSLKNDL